MRKRRLRVLLAFDVEGDRATDADYERFMATEESWFTEGHVLATLRKNGHEVALLPVFDHPRDILDRIDSFRPDLVWNSVETLRGDRYFEGHVVAVLELLGVPYTGTGLLGLMLCKDKALAKKILKHHHVGVPPFAVSRRSQPLRSLDPALLPAFVKPLASEGSEGIARDSFAENEALALKRAAFVHESLGQDAIIEGFIAGRELYVSLLGTRRPRVLPPRELMFANVPEGEPTYASFAAKWDRDYRRRWGIRSDFPGELPEPTRREIERVARRTFRVLQMFAYGRIDMRLRADGRLFVMEANPNPEIAMYEDFAEAAGKAGVTYEELIERICRMSFERKLS